MVVALNPTGKADWTDYQDYWRDDDAEWLQERTILRYASSAARSAADQWPTPSPGQVTWNQETDQIEYFTHSTPTKWIGVLASQHLRITPKTATDEDYPVVLGHKGAGGGGIQFFPTVSGANKISLPSAFLDIGGGSIIARPTSLLINTGVATAILTTDADSLHSNIKITAPNATLAALTVTGASTLVGGTFSGTITGGASSIISANSGTLGGVLMATNYATASVGYVSQAGYFHGDINAAYMQYRNPSGGAVTANYLRVDNANLLYNGLGASVFDIRKSTLRLFDAQPIQFFSPADALLGNLGPVVYTASAIVATNYPEGTIWVTP